MRGDRSAGMTPSGHGACQAGRKKAPPAPGAEAQWRAALHTIHGGSDNLHGKAIRSGGRDAHSTPRRICGAQFDSGTSPGKRSVIIAPFPQPIWIVEHVNQCNPVMPVSNRRGRTARGWARAASTAGRGDERMSGIDMQGGLQDRKAREEEPALW